MKTIGILSLTDPSATNTGGTIRTRFIEKALKTAGLETYVFYPGEVEVPSSDLRPGRRTELAKNLRAAKRKYVPMPTMTGGWDRSIADKIAMHVPAIDAIVVTALSQYRIAQSLGKPIWFDFMDLWSEFGKRESEARGGLARVTARIQALHLSLLEQKVLDDVELVTAAGWRDSEIIKQHRQDVTWLPTTMPDSDFTNAYSQRRAQRRTAGFLANFEYWPNIDAFNALIEYWLPPLQAAGWNVLVAGYRSGDLNVQPNANINILGAVADVNDFYSNVDVTLAPIRLGGGIKVKIIESLSRGVPVIASPRALEGFPPHLHELVSVVDIDGPEQLNLPIPPQWVDPADARLDAFRASNATDVVRRLVEGWTHG